MSVGAATPVVCRGAHNRAEAQTCVRGLLVTGAKLSDLAAVTAPTLIMAGDDDLVAVEHLEAMRTTLPDGQLAIVPGTSHGLPLEKPELVSRLIFDFLSDEQAEKLMASPK